MPKPKTHFEQVPVEIVKKIAEEDIPDDEVNGNDAVDAEDTPGGVGGAQRVHEHTKDSAEKKDRYGRHDKEMATCARLGNRSVS